MDEEMRRVLKTLPEMPASFDSPEETNMMRISLEEQNPLTVRMMNEEESGSTARPCCSAARNAGKKSCSRSLPERARAAGVKQSASNVKGKRYERQLLVLYQFL